MMMTMMMMMMMMTPRGAIPPTRRNRPTGRGERRGGVLGVSWGVLGSWVLGGPLGPLGPLGVSRQSQGLL
eukprot:5077587-Pyramimonas_sp.AAC.1